MEKWNWAVVGVAAALMLFLMFRGGGCCGHTGSPRRNREASAPPPRPYPLFLRPRLFGQGFCVPGTGVNSVVEVPPGEAVRAC